VARSKGLEPTAGRANRFAWKPMAGDMGRWRTPLVPRPHRRNKTKTQLVRFRAIGPAGSRATANPQSPRWRPRTVRIGQGARPAGGRMVERSLARAATSYSSRAATIRRTYVGNTGCRSPPLRSGRPARGFYQLIFRDERTKMRVGREGPRCCARPRSGAEGSVVTRTAGWPPEHPDSTLLDAPSAGGLAPRRPGTRTGPNSTRTPRPNSGRATNAPRTAPPPAPSVAAAPPVASPTSSTGILAPGGKHHRRRRAKLQGRRKPRPSQVVGRRPEGSGVLGGGARPAVPYPLPPSMAVGPRLLWAHGLTNRPVVEPCDSK